MYTEKLQENQAEKNSTDLQKTPRILQKKLLSMNI